MKRISRAATERAYKLAAELHASRGAKVDGNDVARAAREAGIAPGQVWRALAKVRQEKSRGARPKAFPSTRGADILVAVVGVIASLVFGAAAIATIKDGLRLLAASEYLGAILVLAMAAGMLVITANVAYQAVGAMRERSKSRG
ncbi:MAG TPA: hypothetical protein VF647_04960 [Longimicrobium sp.]|jgi:hypothetical protein